MRSSKKTPRPTLNTNQQQSNTFKMSLKAWQARYKEQRASQGTNINTNTTSHR